MLLPTTGMLSKSKGQILRVSAVLHVLFHIHLPDATDCEESNDESSNSISTNISNDALSAAIDFVGTSIQHAAYIAGKGDIKNEATKVTQPKSMSEVVHTLYLYTIKI